MKPYCDAQMKPLVKFLEIPDNGGEKLRPKILKPPTRWLFCVNREEMSNQSYLRAYQQQKRNATARGIEFKLTFKEWCDFWGKDIERRGRGRFDLQMQRFSDQGSYEIGNIKKGHPKGNAKTAGVCKQNRKTERRRIEHQAELDRLMFAESGEEEDALSDDEAELSRLGIKSSYEMSYRFVADK